MKKTSFLMATVALFATVACSHVDDPIDVITADMATSYARIAISMPSATGTRAFGDEANFDEGTAEESRVNSIALVLYSEEDIVVGSGAPVDPPGNDGYNFDDGEENTIEKTKGIVFKLSLNEGAPKPTKVVAFINTDPVLFNLSEVEEESTYNKVPVTGTFLTGQENKSFPMTNSGYYEGNGTTYTVAADLVDENIYADASSAGATEAQIAATIYVERLAAKVTVTNSAESGVPQNLSIKDVNGKDVTIDFDPTTWGATGTAKDMYLLKKKFTYDAWMNKAAWSRSLWAEGTNWDVDYTYGYLDDGEKTSTKVLDYLSFDKIETDLGDTPVYVPEHTYNYARLASEPLFNPIVPSTSAIIIGSYSLAGDNVETYFGTGDTYDFYLRYTGATGTGEDATSNYTIYNKSQLIAYLIGRSLPDVQVSTTSGSLTAITPETNLTGNLDVEKNDAGKYVIKLADGATSTGLYKGAAFDEEIDVEELYYASFTKHYSEGQAYFYVPIKHNDAQKDKNGYYGVVRNHAYELNITAITGLGAPLDEDLTGGEDGEGPFPPIVPDPEDLKEAYIQATINILKWHKVGQDVELK